MKDKVIEFVRDYYKWTMKEDGFGIERYVDYRDEFPESIIKKALESDNPSETFEEEVFDMDCQCDDWYYENDFWSKFNSFCEENDYDKDEAQDIVRNTFYWCYPDSFLNPDVSTMWIINHGDMNYDYTFHNILNYAANYGYCKGLEEKAGLWWLAKQQGKLTELKQAINGKSPKHYFTTRKLICDLRNYANKIGNQFSGYAKRYLSESKDILNHINTWEWFLNRDGDNDKTIREFVIEYCKEYKIPIFEYERSNFTDSCITELENCSNNIAALQFMVRMPLQDIITIMDKIKQMENDKDFSIYHPTESKKDYGYITLDKSTMCGLFEPWGDGGSLMEIQLEKDVKLPLKFLRRIISNDGYQNCCSVMEDCWKETIKEIKLKEIA